jgi:hypothetical protein
MRTASVTQGCCSEKQHPFFIPGNPIFDSAFLFPSHPFLPLLTQDLQQKVNSLTHNKFGYYNEFSKSIPSGHPSPFPSPLQGEREGVRGQFERN